MNGRAAGGSRGTLFLQGCIAGQQLKASGFCEPQAHCCLPVSDTLTGTQGLSCVGYFDSGRHLAGSLQRGCRAGTRVALHGWRSLISMLLVQQWSQLTNRAKKLNLKRSNRL